jgi:hypothetical protein
MAEHRKNDAELGALTQATEALRPSDDLTESLMARIASDESMPELARLAQATSTLEVRADFVDATMALVLAELGHSGDHDAAPPMARSVEDLAQLTADLEPTAGFADVVMQAVKNDAAPSSAPSPSGRGIWSGVTRSGGAALFVAAAVAAVCVLFSSYTERRLDTDVMASVDPVEVSE